MEGGYRYVCRDGSKIALHRLVVQEREGRVLSSGELVHHVDHNRLNNSPDNLVILSRAEHQRLHTLGIKKTRWSAEETQHISRPTRLFALDDRREDHAPLDRRAGRRR